MLTWLLQATVFDGFEVTFGCILRYMIKFFVPRDFFWYFDILSLLLLLSWQHVK